ncbi:MAG TPA: DUF465 domain-containing protein [Gammaproteobacteria bacterium]|nr:DUF465 domain-containing protein [Gammaproteobacteria bacterium]
MQDQATTLKHQLDKLIAEHAELHSTIERLGQELTVADEDIRMMKRRKLQIKDNISQLQSQLLSATG